MIFPVYWMVATAFKPGQQILSYTPQWVPTHPTLSNFRDAIHQPFFWNAVKNSLIVTSVVVVLSLVLAFLAALALAKFSFYGRKPFIVVILTSLSIIWDFQVFQQIWVMLDFRPTSDYYTMAIYAFHQSFQISEYGLGAAIAVVMVMFMFAATLVYLRQMLRTGEVH